MRIDEVLRRADLQKGAFYHHFGSKTELGYIVLEELISSIVELLWLQPLADIVDPINDIPSMIDKVNERVPDTMRFHGCPLNNLALEMSSQDEGFRQRAAVIFGNWIDALTATLGRARDNGYLDANTDCRMVSRFIIATLEGSIGIYKIEQSAEQWEAYRSQIAMYLSTLRPQTGTYS